MDDVDEESACLRYIEGPHKEEVLPHEAPDSDEPFNLVPPAELIDLSLAPGLCHTLGER